MKNDIKKEISNIQRLIKLNESTNSECEDQLEDDGYLVYNPNEQKTLGVDCEEKPNIKRIRQMMEDGGISNAKVRKAAGGNCYIEFKHNEGFNYPKESGGTVFWNKLYLYFWENGEVSLIQAVDPTESRENVEGDKYFQFMYVGTYTIESGEIQIKNFEYDASFFEFNTNKPIKKIWKLQNMGKNVDEIYPKSMKVTFSGGKPQFDL
jgi:hypothetical protein